MTQIDSPFEVRVVGSHVVGADQVVNALAWAANGGDHIVAGFHFGNIQANGLDSAENLMANHEEVKSHRGGPVFRGIDLSVSSIDTDAQNFDQNTAPIRDFLDRRFGQVSEMNAVRLSRKHTYSFHSISPLKIDLELSLRTPRYFVRAACVYLTPRSAASFWSPDQSSPFDGLHLHLCRCRRGSTRETESARSNWDHTGTSECLDRPAARPSHLAGKSE